MNYWIIECLSKQGWVTSHHSEIYDGKWLTMGFDKMIDILSCDSIQHAEMHYRARDTLTGEIIPADIFV